MSFSVKITRDDVSPAFAKIDAALHQLRPVLEAIGLEVVSISQRSFYDASLRITPWAPKRDGSPATLIDSGELKKNIFISNITGTTVTVSAAMIYAAIHQVGGTIQAAPGKSLKFTVGGVTYFVKRVTIPARPFFPIDKSGNLSSLAQRKIAAVLEKALKAYLPALN